MKLASGFIQTLARRTPLRILLPKSLASETRPQPCRAGSFFSMIAQYLGSAFRNLAALVQFRGMPATVFRQHIEFRGFEALSAVGMLSASPRTGPEGTEKHLVRSVREGEAALHVIHPVSEGWHAGWLLFATESFAGGVGALSVIDYLTRMEHAVRKWSPVSG
jgi:hypothetical protein